MLDFSQNIDSLELMVWNFILNESYDDYDLLPKNHDSLRREELIVMIKPSYFNDEKRQVSFKHALRFFKEYSKIPNRNELKTYLEVNQLQVEPHEFFELYEFNLKDYNYDYLYKYVKSFILLRNLNLTMIDLITDLKTSSIDPNNVDAVTDRVRNSINEKLALNFSSGDSGLNFFDPESHVQIAKTSTPTGFEFFDKVLGGGWNPKSLVVFQGRPKVGKSMVLGNIAVRSMLAGNVTGLVTVELSDRQYMKRIGSNVLNIKADEYASIIDSEKAEIVKKRLSDLKAKGTIKGDLYLKEFPTGGVTAIEIENYFIRLQNRLGIKFTVIVVDYLNLLQPIKEKDGMYEKIKTISEELRGVAMRNEWCIISATQIKREAVKDLDLGMESVAESFGLIHTVDSLFGLMRAPLERRMKIKVIANRDNGYEESYKYYQMESDYFRLTEEVGPTSQFYSDDEEINQMIYQIREENRGTQLGPNKTEATEPNLPTANKPVEPDYDDLLSSL